MAVLRRSICEFTLTRGQIRMTLVAEARRFAGGFGSIPIRFPPKGTPPMAVRSASDLIYATIARLPFLLVIAGVVWVLFSGVLALETFSFGSEYLIGNDQTTNALPTLPGPSDQDILDAVASGDVDRMSAVLDQAQAQQDAAYGQASGVQVAPGGFTG